MRLKNAFLIGMTAMTLGTATAQTEKNHKPLVVDQLYAGLYGINTIDSTTLETKTLAAAEGNLRVGGTASYELLPRLKAKALLVYDKTIGEEEKLLSLYNLSYAPSSTTTITIGKGPVAATKLVASPVTPGGHFLFTPEAQVPVGAMGLKVDQKIGEHLSVSGASAYRKGDLEHSLYVGVSGDILGNLASTGVLKNDQLSFGALHTKKFQNKSSLFTMVWFDKKTTSFASMYTTARDLSIFIDGQYDRTKKQFGHTQLGVLKSLNGKTLNAKFGAGFDLVRIAFQSFLFINLSGKDLVVKN